MFEEIFAGKRANPGKLEENGFARDGEDWLCASVVSGGAFRLEIRISKNGAGVDTRLTDLETGDLYTLYKTDAVGSFVGAVRSEIETRLRRISDSCFDSSAFKSRQAQLISEFVRQSYGDELEFLWPDFPDNAIMRRKDSRKWYGVIMTVSGSKIGLEDDARVEIIDVRMPREDAPAVLAQKGCYPGWHMNKKTWYTMVLDHDTSDADLTDRIAASYRLVGK